MFSRLENSWELVKASARVLQKDKELLVFPLIAVFASILVTAGFMVPLIGTSLGEKIVREEENRALAGAVVFLFYIAQYFVLFFANAGLVGAALIRLRGGDPTVGDGLRIATRHVGKIFVYSMIAATVGMALRMIAERLGFIGRIIIRLIGAAWAIATFLTIPVLVSEEVGPVDAISRSMSLLKKTWGEQLIAGAGIGILFNWLIFFSVMTLMGGLYLTNEVLHAPMGNLLVVGLFFTWVLGLSLLRSALTGIYAAALYRYAAEGDAGSDFRPELIQSAFRSK